MKIPVRAHRRLRKVFLVSAALVSPTGFAQVDNNEGPITTLEGIEVRGQSMFSELPPGTTTTTRHELQTRSINDWSDFARRAEPGLHFNRRNKSVNIRGMDADRVVTQIDGVRIPWLTDGARGVEGGLDSVAFGSLSAVDIVRGAGAARSGALTGAVELRTLSPNDVLSAGRDFGALLDSGYDSADNSWRASATLAGRVKNDTRWLLQLGQRRGNELENYGGADGYGDERIKMNPQEYRQDNLLLKLQHDLDPSHAVEFSGERFRHKADIDNRRAQGPGTSFQAGNNSTKEHIDRDRVLLGYRFQAAERSKLDNGNLKAYWQRLRLESRQQAMRTRDARGQIIPGDPFRYSYPFGPFMRDNLTQESGFGATTEWNGYIDTRLRIRVQGTQRLTALFELWGSRNVP